MECLQMKAADDLPVKMDKSLLLKLELFDGTSQIVQITEEEAADLGINIAENRSFINPLTTEVQNVQQLDTNGIQDNSLAGQSNGNENEGAGNYTYKILKPEDLDLKPVATPHAPRGRPRKRPIEQVSPEQTKPSKEREVIMKQVRTRSGRITKPPRYIRQDFKLMVTSDDGRLDAEFKTVELDSLKPNDSLEIEPHVHLEQHSKKRNIPSHYRCPTCKKAYLGKIKMVNHFRKYPDHGPVPTFCKIEHNSTWNFLILTTQKFKEGSKGVKFCQELEVLLENARALAKFFFKPVENDEGGYFVDDYLAHVFGIVPGNYILNENELHKDAYLFAFLEKTCTRSKESNDVTCQDSRQNGVRNHTDEESSRKNDANSASNECVRTVGDEQIREDVKTDMNAQEEVSKLCSSTAVVVLPRDPVEKIDLLKTSFSSQMMNPCDQPLVDNICDEIFSKDRSSVDDDNPSDREKCNSREKSSFLLDQNDIKFGNRHAECVLDSAKTLASDYQSLNVETPYNALKTDEQKQNLPNCAMDGGVSQTLMADDKCNNYDNINKHIMLANDILSQVDDLILENSNASVKQQQNQIPLRCVSDKKCNDYNADKHSLHNGLLSPVDELMLENIDTGQVSHILDTSSNSDDIMNVDQFVNERFKKLTEPDMELQNTSLNLDLPPLDMFNFHTS